MNAERYFFVPGTGGGPHVVRGEGAYLFTADGRAILDAAGGALVSNIGHGRAEVAEAVAAALRNLDYVVPTWTTPNRVALVERLVERWLPAGFNRVFFTSGGSESVDSAVRLARAYQRAKGRDERWKVIGRLPSYHGATLATIAVGGHQARRAAFEPLLLDFPKARWDDADAVAKLVANDDEIAAFIAEPIIGSAGGCLVADDDYWDRVVGACADHDVLVIADEVMCGFGRTGKKWGHEHWAGFRPDVITCAKGLSAGYSPLGCVAATDRVVEPLAESLMFFTYSAHDAACAAALSVLDILEREDLVAKVADLGARLETAVRRAIGGHPMVTEIRGRGLMLGIELTCDPIAVARAGLQKGVWFYPSVGSIMIGPPFTIGDAEIDTIATVLAESLPSG